jgi:hypothetical protein
MTNAPTTSEPAPLLRTLSPALRGLGKNLRDWLGAPHRYPLSTLTRAALEGLASDLRRAADALDVDRPLLVLMLMGGTGVGKSTLLNALAGGSIAQASFTRPTTRDPVVYYHESVRPDRLPPELRHCKLVPHDRPELEHKILVDTPDLDSNVLAHREKVLQMLPVADIVLYVGSQEKYHDRIGWDLFLRQRRRKAFAFVMNKWDRCAQASATGLRPDEDMLRDLEAQGFKNPRLFRTCAQFWVDHPAARRAAEPGPNGAAFGPAPADASPDGRPEGEQFQELLGWVEQGLTRKEIEAIKAKGVSQLLEHLQQALADASPPDLADEAARTRAGWEEPLAEEARATTDVLLAALEPFHKEIEHHFALEGQRRFRGLMGTYLHLVTRVRFVGSTLRDRIPFLPRSGGEPTPAPTWDLARLTRACSDVAANRQLDARGRALANRLLVQAGEQGFPVDLLTEAVERQSRVDWRQRYAQTLNEVLQHVEQQWARPTGARRVVQGLLVFLADWVPLLALLAALVNLLWRYFDPRNQGYQVHLPDVLLPLVVLAAVLVILHLLIALLLPLRWGAIRDEFGRQLARRIRDELEEAYGPLPDEVAESLRRERQRVERLAGEAREVAAWLREREQSSGIAGLYGD